MAASFQQHIIGQATRGKPDWYYRFTDNTMVAEVVRNYDSVIISDVKLSGFVVRNGDIQIIIGMVPENAAPFTSFEQALGINNHVEIGGDAQRTQRLSDLVDISGVITDLNDYGRKSRPGKIVLYHNGAGTPNVVANIRIDFKCSYSGRGAGVPLADEEGDTDE